MAGKFKIGDVVRLLVDESLGSPTKKGEIGIIVFDEDTDEPSVHVGQGTIGQCQWYIDEKDMELVEYSGESNE